MKILNQITYTVYSTEHRAHWECSTSLIRRYKLTMRGAERLLRRGAYPGANVVRMEYAVFAR